MGDLPALAGQHSSGGDPAAQHVAARVGDGHRHGGSFKKYP